jgi:hypothetical protein
MHTWLKCEKCGKEYCRNCDKVCPCLQPSKEEPEEKDDYKSRDIMNVMAELEQAICLAPEKKYILLYPEEVEDIKKQERTKVINEIREWTESKRYKKFATYPKINPEHIELAEWAYNKALYYLLNKLKLIATF